MFMTLNKKKSYIPISQNLYYNHIPLKGKVIQL